MTVKHPQGVHHERVRKHLDRLPAVHVQLQASYRGPSAAQVQAVEQQVQADVQAIAAGQP